MGVNNFVDFVVLDDRIIVAITFSSVLDDRRVNMNSSINYNKQRYMSCIKPIRTYTLVWQENS